MACLVLSCLVTGGSAGTGKADAGLLYILFIF